MLCPKLTHLQHVLSRKHRKFAEKVENWKELDALLNQLARPLREANEDDY
jgi:regulatory subunit for Cdc7p protein kinase